MPQSPEAHNGLKLSLPTYHMLTLTHIVRMHTSFYLCGPLCLDIVIEETKSGCRATDIPHVLLPGNLGQLCPNHNSAPQDPGGEKETQVKLGTPARADGGGGGAPYRARCQSVAWDMEVHLAEAVSGEVALQSWVMQESELRGRSWNNSWGKGQRPELGLSPRSRTALFPTLSGSFGHLTIRNAST